MAKYVLKYMYDWCSGTCLWSVNKEANEKYGYLINLDKLPLSDKLRKELDLLVDKHDEALDWDHPQNPLLWTEQEQAEFTDRAKRAYYLIVKELGDEYEVELWENCLI